ncbi:peptide antibiotic transporter SbmA [Reyranella sp.]|uniref:peptide antibiotic transporter SbmA n=1 Tax=Reyranella sp. TaxID=1929291 RepID=UPI003D14E4AC
MFSSFFPTPRLFFPAALLWTALTMALWYGLARDLGPQLSLGWLAGYAYPPAGADGANVAVESARNIWLFEYMIATGALFVGLVRWLMPHPWWRWSVAVSALIVFLLWFQVQLDVMINTWFGSFYNMVQKALATPGAITQAEFFGQLVTFGGIAMVYILTAVLTAFITSHYVFRWRQAMNDFYVGHWERLRHIEGASQRIQEDTQKFSSTVEGLGASLVQALMTLIAFLPILWGLSSYVKELPLVGPVPQALVFVAVLWAAIGTAALAVAGIRLPGLEFRNQRVEAAFRKELVLGEDDPVRAQPPTLHELFGHVRANYFRLYANFLYFNVVRYAYLQTSVLIPYIALAPSIVAGGMTLGVMQQVIRAFGRVESSFQYLVQSWTTIISLISVYKRLRAFEATLRDEPLGPIEAEAVVR